VKTAYLINASTANLFWATLLELVSSGSLNSFSRIALYFYMYEIQASRFTIILEIKLRH
jgi:hypothetical protein